MPAPTDLALRKQVKLIHSFKPNLLQASTTAILIYFVLSLKKTCCVTVYTQQPESNEIGGILKIFPGEFEHKF